MDAKSSLVELKRWRVRARLYGMTLIVVLTYLLVGRVSSKNQKWVEVDLPVSAAALLLVGLAGVEAYFVIQRLQRRYQELQAARSREIELAERLSEQRRSILNQVSRTLLDKLNLRQLPPDVVEKVALLFETDVVSIWLADRSAPKLFIPRGVSGLTETAASELGAIGHASPCFEKVLQHSLQLTVTDFRRDTAPPMAAFCEREGLLSAIFTPIVCHDTIVGIIGAFYRQKRDIPLPLAVEMQTVANLIASAVQAEELYHTVAESQKIDSLGNLATGIAHDFNNILAATLSCVSYVKQHTDPASPSHRYLAAAETSIHRGAALSKQLLSFVRREGPPATVLNPNQVIGAALNLLERSFEKNLRIQRRFAPDLCPVEINETQLEQVVLNICLNARDAMPHGGTLTVSSRNVRLDNTASERATLALRDGNYVVLSFRDSGLGMNEETRRRIFEPFFSTKQGGKGSGLGLALVQNIIQNARGDITVDTAPGQGSLFEVFLPASTKPLPSAGRVPAAETRTGGGEHILLAEDEEVIREMTQLALQSRGYTVTTASDGATALALYQQRWKDIDLVIADMVMPRIGGMELLARMKEINPNVRVIVSSGFSRELEGQHMLQYGCLGYLQKPYDTQALQRLVRSVLDSSQ
jgi:signal transduction histidine kinase/CheY-like chemotaxis protein